MLKFLILFWLWLKVTTSVEQSYSYYSGNDGTDKDPQVVSYTYTEISIYINCLNLQLHC